MHFITWVRGGTEKKILELNDLYLYQCPFFGHNHIYLSVRCHSCLIMLCLFLYRFNGGKFYTYIGEVCVSVNPYRTLNIYGPDYVSQYKGIFCYYAYFDKIFYELMLRREGDFWEATAYFCYRRCRLQNYEERWKRYVHRHQRRIRKREDGSI